MKLYESKLFNFINLNRLEMINLDQLSCEERYACAFLATYLYALEDDHNLLAKISKEVSFHSDEANTDDGLKRCLKEYFLQKPTLTCEENFTFCLNINDVQHIFNFDQLSVLSIKNVYLPSELSDIHIEYIKNSKSGMVFTNPDLLLEFCINGKVVFVSLELKSTKNNKIPGSSVQQINPYEWVIFVKKDSKNEVLITTGIYANSVTGRVQFPDRSPRPEVSFSTLGYWNAKNRSFNSNVLSLSFDSEEIETKVNDFINWQQRLVDDWMVCVKSEDRHKPWFKHTLRMFVTDLLEYYESLDDDRKKEFIELNKKFI